MSARCLVCKQEFRPPAAHAARTMLLVCPHCGFIGLWDGERFGVPTYEEETSLERIEGEELRDSSSPAGDRTVAEEWEPELPLPYKRRLFLKVLTGSRKGEVVAFDSGRAVIGRNEGDVGIDDPKISRKHAVVEAISRENVFVRDLASTNGTWLNGVRVGSKKLRNGDIIRVGSTELQFLWQDED